MINRIKIIISLLTGKSIVVYDYWHKEVLMIIGNDEEVFKKRYNYAFISEKDRCLKDINGKIYYTGDDYE